MNRKPVGKGYVFQRVRKNPTTGQVEKDKTWSFRFTVGKQLIQRYGFESKREAEIAFHKAKTEEGATGRRVSTRFTFGTAMDLYLNDLKTRRDESFERRVLERVKELWGKRPLVSIRVEDVDEYRNTRSRETVRQGTTRPLHTPRPLTLSTLNRELNYLRSFFSYCIKREWLPEGANPASAKKITRYPEPKDRPYALTQEQFEKLLDLLPEFREWLLLAYYLGVRVGVLDDLAWEMVDFEREEIRYISKGKTGVIEMNTQVREILQGFGPRASGRILEGRREAIPWKRFKKAAAALGIPRLRRHDLRVTFATNAADAGASVKTIQELLNHRTAEMSLRYIQSSRAAKRIAVANLPRISAGSKVESKHESKGSGVL